MGETNRSIARSGLMGRRKAQDLREQAEQQGWLDPERSLPDEAELATLFSTTSLIEPYHDQDNSWLEEGIQGMTIYQALIRRYGFSGSYSSLRRYLSKLKAANPRMTSVIEFAPGDAALIDFGAGSRIVDQQTGGDQKNLDLCHDPDLEPAHICRVHLGPKRGHLAGLSPPGV